MENCSIYSHHIWFKEIVNVVINLASEKSIKIIGEEDSWESITIYGNAHNSQNKMILTSKVREIPSFKLDESEDELTTKLNVIRNYFGAIDTDNPKLLEQLMYKISSTNMEINVEVENGFNQEFEEITYTITDILEGFIFSNNNSIFDAPDSNNGIFNENGDVILCKSGYSDVKKLDLIIEKQYLEELKSLKI